MYTRHKDKHGFFGIIFQLLNKDAFCSFGNNQQVIVMRIIGVMVIASLVISGCATVKETYAPDGRKAYALNCSGLTRGWDKCRKAAGDICGSAGYDILDQVSEDSSFSREKTGVSGGLSHSIKTNERSMLIACKR